MKQVHITTGNYISDNDLTIDPSLVVATDSAQPTSRVLDGSSDHGYAQEWLEPAVMPDGTQCKRVYLFDDDDITDDDGEPLEAEDYPWDDNHVARILLND